MRRELLETAALLNAVTAMFGGLGLAFGLIHPPMSWLQHSPFDSYVLPGVILAVAAGGSALAGYIAQLEKARSANLITYLSGLIMCCCILAAVALLRGAHALLYLYFVLGAIIMAGSYNEAKRMLLTRHR